MIIKCDLCNNELDEKEMQESHDVPAYLFIGYPNERRNSADKFGRHWLCKRCHLIYESYLKYKLFFYTLNLKKQFWSEN